MSLKSHEVHESELLRQILSALSTDEITAIRCLALGPLDETVPLYQLELLKEIATAKNVEPTHVSLYDPVFSQEHIDLLDSLQFKVEEESSVDSETTLYFLPHAGLDITESLFNTSQPCLLLANNLVSHTERLSSQKLFDKYPVLATLMKMSTVQKPKDEFTVVKRKNRKKKTFQEPHIDYDFDSMYFSRVEITSLLTTGPWGNAFTDLAVQKVVTRTKTEVTEEKKVTKEDKTSNVEENKQEELEKKSK